MKLKRRKRSESRDPNVCSANRCKSSPAIILATKALDNRDVHLCDKHWQQHCDEQDAEIERQEALITKMLRPKLPPGLKPGRYTFRYTKDLELEAVPGTRSNCPYQPSPASSAGPSKTPPLTMPLIGAY